MVTEAALDEVRAALLGLVRAGHRQAAWGFVALREPFHETDDKLCRMTPAELGELRSTWARPPAGAR